MGRKDDNVGGDDGGARSSAQADLELARRAADGGREAQAALVGRLLECARGISYLLGGGGRDFEDDAQDALVEVLGAAGSFRGESSLEAWARRVMVRVVMRRIRRRRSKRLQLVEDPSVAVGVDGSAKAPSQDHEAAEALRLIEGITLGLGPKRREAWVLCKVYGMSAAEAADALEVPPATVQTRVQRAHKEMVRRVGSRPDLLELIRGRGIKW